MSITASRLLAAIACAVLLFGCAIAPQQPWRQHASIDDSGFSSAALDEAHTLAKRIGSAAVFAVHEGVVIAAWGDIDRPFKVHSVRKSLLSALYGVRQAQGTIDIERSLADLDIDDLQSLTEVEKTASVVDLLSARSGVYHPSAYEPTGMAEGRPQRGSHSPGTHWFYNNWDFNTLGTIYMRATGADLFEDFKSLIADPLGMEDLSLDHTWHWLEPSRSRHAAYTFRMSARDMARFGQLYAQRGKWNGRQIVPAEWIDRSWKLHTTFDNGNGYGFMWWVYPGSDDATSELRKHDCYAAIGTGGQLILIAPDIDFVFVHRGDSDSSDGVTSGGDVWRVAEMVYAARTGDAVVGAPRETVHTKPLNELPPAPQPPIGEELSREMIDAMVGRYRVQNPPLQLNVFEHDHRLFMTITGVFNREIEMRPGSDGSFASAMDWLPIVVERSEDGTVSRLTVTRQGMRMTAVRVKQ